MLEEMREKGLITEEDYKNKKSKLTDMMEEKPALMPSEDAIVDESGDEKVKKA